MGDRTYVSITIHKNFYRQLVKLAGGTKAKLKTKICPEEIQDRDDLVTFSASEVNYATWDELEDLLQAGKIEYDKEWAAGENYPAGNSYFRYVAGKWQEIEVSKDEIEVINVLEAILKEPDIKAAVEKDLACRIHKKIEKLKDG